MKDDFKNVAGRRRACSLASLCIRMVSHEVRNVRYN